MGWLIGYTWKTENGEVRDQISAMVKGRLHTVSIPDLEIVAGGIEETCLRGESLNDSHPEAKSKWIVCGLGVRADQERSRFLSVADWSRILAAEKPNLSEIDGHFVICRWCNGELEFFTDQLGIRTVYFTQRPDGIVFSTRIDWITQLADRPSIDFRQFGSRWLTYNPLSQECDITGITRLGQLGHAKVTPHGIFAGHRPWLMKNVSATPGAYLSHLKALSNPVIPPGRRLSFGLSGGFDSRVLLALLLSRKTNFRVHIFGDHLSVDVAIASDIARREGLEYSLYDDAIPGIDDCVGLLRDYARQAYLGDPASTGLKLRYYPQLHTEKYFTMDGAFGELSRRMELVGLYHRGKSALKSRNALGIIPSLAVHRGHIFNNEVLTMMRTGIESQLQALIDEMPPIAEIGMDNFLDLLTIRTRIAHWCSLEQSRVDQAAVNYMPYLQPSLLNIILSLPGELRRNARIMRQIVSVSRPSLRGYSLVKRNTTYPYFFNSVGSYFWTKSKQRMGLIPPETTGQKLFTVLKPFVLDTLNSQQVRSFAAYDYRVLSAMVNDYYEGNLALGNQLDWWLAFELWREELGLKG